MTFLDLPASVLAKVERSPVEDMILYVLRDKLADVPVFTLIPEDPPDMFALVRKDDPIAPSRVDEHALGYADFFINVFATDPAGDIKAALISEAIRVVLRDAWLDKLYVPQRGWIIRTRETSPATRVTDWATSSGPVQYADLPAGFTRYESKFSVKWRRDINSSFTD